MYLYRYIYLSINLYVTLYMSGEEELLKKGETSWRKQFIYLLYFAFTTSSNTTKSFRNELLNIEKIFETKILFE